MEKAEDDFPWFRWVIIGVVCSFCLGIALFLNLAREPAGDPIPPDAGPRPPDSSLQSPAVDSPKTKG